MVEIFNVQTYDLKESVIACRNAMRLKLPDYTNEEFNLSLKRAIALASSKNGSGHQNFLCGIRVAFDIKYPNYFTPELQRYHFNDIVASSSKMHRLLKMNLDESCNKYVTLNTIRELTKHIEVYNYIETLNEKDFSYRFINRDHTMDMVYNKSEALYRAFMNVLSNCPLGIELFMRCTTNYLQLRTIYNQRKNHRLREDWGNFCKFIEELPYSKEFITLKE